ncbi:MAG: type II secretion system F family protein [Isosphaeraceae bacterium]
MANDPVGRRVGGPVSLDDLIALNDEIIALTRSGMPLERGLLDVGRDLPGRLQAVTVELGQRTSRGESLPRAIEGLGDALPSVYRSVVVAGIRSGNLPSALEGIAGVARGVAEARRAIGLALWYPLIVTSMAYALFLFIVSTVLPKFEAAFLDMGLPIHGTLVFLIGLSRTMWLWGPVFPALLAFFILAWFSTRGALSLQGRGRIGFLRWFPWMGQMIRDFEAASFAELLALLVEHGVPYPESLRLAGEASGDRALLRASQAIAARVAQGQSADGSRSDAWALPPMLGWLVATGPATGDFPGALRQMASRYRREALLRSEKIRVLVPTLMLCGIGASATMLYALALFLPISTLWNSLATPLR